MKFPNNVPSGDNGHVSMVYGPFSENLGEPVPLTVEPLNPDLSALHPFHRH